MITALIYIVLLFLPVLGALTSIICMLIITLDKMKRSKSTKKLCIFLIIYLIISIIWYCINDYFSNDDIKKIGSYTIGMGILISPIMFLIIIPGNVYRQDKDKNANKLYLIGLGSGIFSILCSILIIELGHFI